MPLGTLAATHRGSWTDRLLSWMAGLQLSMPVFVIGTLLILLFAQTLRWVPAGGYTPFGEVPVRHLIHLSMPAFAIAVGLSAVIFRMVRDYRHRDAGARLGAHGPRQGSAAQGGAPRHVVRNALGLVVTVVGLHVGTPSAVRFSWNTSSTGPACRASW
ncbi:MAG: ABC transporter permease subunit [Geminicoccaceae bacterium]